jgi:hypothetical protein
MHALALHDVGDGCLTTVRMIRKALALYQRLTMASTGDITHCTLGNMEMVEHEERRQVSQ